MPYDGPSIDHSILSPCGRISKRAKAAYMARHDAEVAAWWAAKYPAPSEAEKAREAATARVKSLRATAANLRDLAARGMTPRKFTKAATAIEAEADALERTI